MRFIDLAAHGGCSKKMDATGLDKLLSGLAYRCSSQYIQKIFEEKPDAGTYFLGDVELAATVDLIYPAVLDPADFGVIAVNHVASDLYAVGATPLFALSILGVRRGLSPDSELLKDMLHASFKYLENNGILLIGGHSLVDQEDLMLGFSIVGKKNKINGDKNIASGDLIVLTKPLGTSIATGLWKAEAHFSDQFEDVLLGMKTSNQVASNMLGLVGVQAVTDVTGYGFLGHLINLLKRHDSAALIKINDIPLYDSLKTIAYGEQPSSRLFFQNRQYAADYADLSLVDERLANFLIDAQISGGLLAICSKEQYAELEILAGNSVGFSVVGQIVAGNPGRVNLL